ncbi:MAG: hypothetical protein EOO77_16940 [Oxalobacteraceae bacterium]|nr:MAG: hypothetical protein EOO77_16940 [Oxalobacteraceae bacterium]
MAATFTYRPGFDHFVALKCQVDREVRWVRGGGRVDYVLHPLYDTDDLAEMHPYIDFINNRTGVIAEWLAGDHAIGRYTYKFFLDRILVSFEHPDTAFAFKMRFG